MSVDLRAALADYLQLRRDLGYRLDASERLLNQFIGYLETAPPDPAVTVASAVAWARQPADAAPVYHAARMTIARGFAAYLRVLDPSVEVPPPDVLPRGRRRSVPFLYSESEIAALLAHTAALPTPWLRQTYYTLFGLVAVTGMRIGEAIGLDDDDVEAERELLVIRRGKFGKSRLIPLHSSTLCALTRYRGLRDERFPRPVSPALLVSRAGTRLIRSGVTRAFHVLRDTAALTAGAGSRRPRIHDLRHTFAVRTLLDWYRDGGDGGARLPLLSTYLGHGEPADTYWYLQAAPELLE